MRRRILIILLPSLLTAWLCAKCYQQYAVSQIALEIEQTCRKVPQLSTVKANESKPNVILVKGTLQSRKDMGELIHHIQKVMEGRVCLRPTVSFSVTYVDEAD